jgi:hypothetical protein
VPKQRHEGPPNSNSNFRFPRASLFIYLFYLISDLELELIQSHVTQKALDAGKGHFLEPVMGTFCFGTGQAQNNFLSKGSHVFGAAIFG